VARSYWVWVTRPTFYADLDGSDRADLRPEAGTEEPTWWTCHKDTKPGDLVVLYRTAPRSDIAYLFEATSMARTLPKPPMIEQEAFLEVLAKRAEESPQIAAALKDLRERSTRVTAYIAQVGTGMRQEGDWSGLAGSDEPIEDPDAERAAIDAEEIRLAGLPPDTVVYSTDKAFLGAMGWDVDPAYEWATNFVGEDVCSWISLAAFGHPLSLGDMRADPYLADWGALRASFQGTVFGVPEGIWHHLVELLDRSNPGFARLVSERTPRRAAAAARIEKDLEERLALDPTLIAPGLHLYTDRSGRSGRQYWAEGIGRRGAFIDLLCLDSDGDLVVVELKAERASERAVAQTGMYIGWVRQHLAQVGQAVRGMVVAPDHDQRFRYARESRDDIDYVDAVPIARGLGLQW